MNKEDKINQRISQDYDMVRNMGYDVVGVFLQGSQNYELDYEGSDIDTKAIIVPTLEDIVLNKKPVSTTHILDTNEHVDIKDIRLMYECFKKQNINFIEILFTKYFKINELYFDDFLPLLEQNERIARYNIYSALNCIAGMSMEKYKALEHPYPSLKDKIDKYGYDNKQLHHIIRLNEFINRYIKGESYSNCLISTQKDYLINIKKNYDISLDKAKFLANMLNKYTKIVKDKYMEENELFIDKEVETILNNSLMRIIKTNLLTTEYIPRKDF